MIPNAYIQAWSAKAPWPDARQVEQDLIISRALCELEREIEQWHRSSEVSRRLEPITGIGPMSMCIRTFPKSPRSRSPECPVTMPESPVTFVRNTHPGAFLQFDGVFYNS